MEKESLVELIGDSIKSMCEIVYEYSNFNDDLVDSFHVLVEIGNGNYSAVFFYIVDGQHVKRHKLHDVISGVDTSSDAQFGVLDILMEEVFKIESTFKGNDQAIPALTKISYSPKTQKMNTDFDYDFDPDKSDLDISELEANWAEEIIKISN